MKIARLIIGLWLAAVICAVVAILCGCRNLEREYQGWPLKPYPVKQ